MVQTPVSRMMHLLSICTGRSALDRAEDVLTFNLKETINMGSSPDVADPADRPERTIETEAEDVVLGSQDDQPGDIRTQGKRALIKPSGGTSTGSSGLNV